MKHIKKMGQRTPKVLRSLLIAILVVIVAGGTALGAERHTSNLHQVGTQLISRRRTAPGVYSVPSNCSLAAPIVPALITDEEVELRQFQADFSQFIEDQAKLDEAAGLTFDRDVLAIEKYRIDCEIMVLKAKQILATGGDFTLPAIPITEEEIALRKRQFAIAEEIDEEAALSQAAGIASLNSVWRSRRERIDTEILWRQAQTQKKLQDLQNTPE